MRGQGSTREKNNSLRIAKCGGNKIICWLETVFLVKVLTVFVGKYFDLKEINQTCKKRKICDYQFFCSKKVYHKIQSIKFKNANFSKILIANFTFPYTFRKYFGFFINIKYIFQRFFVHTYTRPEICVYIFLSDFLNKMNTKLSNSPNYFFV